MRRDLLTLLKMRRAIITVRKKTEQTDRQTDGRRTVTLRLPLENDQRNKSNNRVFTIFFTITVKVACVYVNIL